MNASHPSAFVHPTSMLPRSAFSRRLEASFKVSPLVKIRKFFEDISARRAKPPANCGGPGQPPEEPAHDSPWDDPAIWMLMMH